MTGLDLIGIVICVYLWLVVGGVIGTIVSKVHGPTDDKLLAIFAMLAWPIVLLIFLFCEITEG
jgi:uncharacterized membrane protein